MSTNSTDAADDPPAQTDDEADIAAEHRRAQKSGEVVEGKHLDWQ